MRESIKELNKQLIRLEKQIDRADDKGGECITMTIEEADNLLRKMLAVVHDEIE